MSIRTFIAVELSGPVKARATQVINKLKVADAKVTWVQPQAMHLTLKFLGDVPDSDIPAVCKIVAEAARKVEPFELVFKGCGAFPNTSAPRTIWLGVDQGAEELTALHEAIDIGLKQLRFPRETRRFQPHLTLGRVKESGAAATYLGQLVEQMSDVDADLTIVDEVVTFASFLERGGPLHEPMGHADLGTRVADDPTGETKSRVPIGDENDDEDEDDIDFAELDRLMELDGDDIRLGDFRGLIDNRDGGEEGSGGSPEAGGRGRPKRGGGRSGGGKRPRRGKS